MKTLKKMCKESGKCMDAWRGEVVQIDTNGVFNGWLDRHEQAKNSKMGTMFRQM